VEFWQTIRDQIHPRSFFLAIMLNIWKLLLTFSAKKENNFGLALRAANPFRVADSTRLEMK
jgi:hypothetical protein